MGWSGRRRWAAQHLIGWTKVTRVTTYDRKTQLKTQKKKKKGGGRLRRGKFKRLINKIKSLMTI
jgi:hypothetical protein